METPSAGEVCLLSWPLSESTPAYGGGDGLTVQALTSIAAGDTANTIRLSFPNHLGTHVDAPRHFFEDGATLDTFRPEFWFFSRVCLMDVPGDDGLLIQPEHLPAPIPHGADLVLLRTGHGLKRITSEYWSAGPGLSPQLGTYLRAERPSVRAVGMDLISVTSRLRRLEGREAHRAFLDPDRVGRPILLVEDMALGEADGVERALISPLFFRNADGGPVTVWGFRSAPTGDPRE